LVQSQFPSHSESKALLTLGRHRLLRQQRPLTSSPARAPSSRHGNPLTRRGTPKVPALGERATRGAAGKLAASLTCRAAKAVSQLKTCCHL